MANRRKRRRGVATGIAVALMIVVFLLGGIIGFCIARNTTPTVSADLQQANERIIELENILTLIGFDVDSEGGDEWIYDGDFTSNAFDGLSDDFSGDITDLWNEDSFSSLSEDSDPVVVAEFDGGELLSTEVIPVYNDELAERVFSGYNAEEIAPSLLQAVLSTMVSEKLMAVKAQEMGLDQLSDEDIARIEQEAAADYEDLLSYYSLYVAEPGMTDEQLRDAAALYAASEYNLSINSLVEEKKLDWWLNKYYDAVVSDVTASDDEARTHYREVLEEQRALFDESPEEFEYAHIYGETLTYHPEGYRAVRDILIPFESDADSLMANDLIDQIATLDPQQDAEAIRSAEEQLNALYATLESLAQEALEKLAAGASFEDLMDEYGCDELLEEEPMRSEGYYISANTDLNSQEYIDGAMMLETPGQVSTPLRSPFGLHIVQYIGDVTPGEVPYEDVADAMLQEVLELKRSEYFEAHRQSLLEGANVRYYPERLQ